MMSNDNLQLEQLSIMGGATEVLKFEINDINGQPFDLSTTTIIWTMSIIGDKENPVVIKDSSSIGGITIQDNGLCIIEINKEDTEMLKDMKMEHELIIEQLNGKVLRPCYGYIYIKQGSIYK